MENDAPHTEGGESGQAHSYDNDSPDNVGRHKSGPGKHRGEPTQGHGSSFTGSNVIDPATGRDAKGN